MGMDYENPTVRDAVAFDLVKLDSPDVSNDFIHLAQENKWCSPLEHERFLLNRNFRVHLVNLEPEWSDIQFVREGLRGCRQSFCHVVKFSQDQLRL